MTLTINKYLYLQFKGTPKKNSCFITQDYKIGIIQDYRLQNLSNRDTQRDTSLEKKE